ncbi:MAG: DUF29 domain-containing protein [Crocosphaera sp.]
MNIYETDYTLWKQKQIEALTHKNWDVIDLQNLIEDLKMGDPRKALRSNLIILIAHLIKLYVQKDAPDWMSNSWYNFIDEHRARIRNEIQDSILKSYFPQAVKIAYPQARKLAILEGKRADGRKEKNVLNLNILNNFLTVG